MIILQPKQEPCPCNGIPLKIDFAEHSGGWDLDTRCPRCGRLLHWTSKDEKK